MNDSKRPVAVSLNALSVFDNALTMFWNDFEMDLQRISVPLKNIANVSKRNGTIGLFASLILQARQAKQQQYCTQTAQLTYNSPPTVSYLYPH